jgi:digeranylgeranylglycerophospholipid reductase
LLDVAVIGGGPAGSRAAYQLASLGRRVTVLEKQAVIGCKTCCTGIISQKCVDQYSIPESVVYSHLNSAAVFSPAGYAIRVFLPQPQAAIINRTLFDRWMADQALTRGVSYWLDCRVKRVDITTGAVEIEYQKEHTTRTLKAKAVVLANGFNSSLVKQLGLGQPAYQVAGVQAVVETLDLKEIEIYFDQKIAPGFFAWLAPTLPGQALAGLMTRQSPGQHLRQWLDKLVEQKRIKPVGFSIQYCGIPLKPLRSTVQERVVVVGDAAGQVKPTTGGGIYWGLQCADMAARSLHQALEKGDYSRKVLGCYEKEWRELLAAEMKREFLARRAYQVLSNRQIDSIFKTMRDNDIVDSLLRDDYTSFDNHGAIILKALKLGLVSSARRITGYLTRA